MIWFWLGFFALVGLLLVLDLGVLHRKQEEPTLKASAYWTAGWMTLGLSFSGVVYLIYENAWLGAHMAQPTTSPGMDAAVTYVSAYLLEQALSVDNIFVIGLLFHSFRVPTKYQHRVLFWGILGAIVFRLIMLGGGAYLATKFSWIFYVFGGYLMWQGIKLGRGGDEDGEDHDKSLAVRALRRVVRIVDGDYGGKFLITIDGKRALTTVAVCLVVIELTDVVFALDSIPAVLSVSQDTFIMVTSNIFAILGLRSLYFVLAGAMDKFRYLKLALAALLVVIGAKMIAHEHVQVSHVVSLGVIAGILAAGVLASIVASRKEEAAASSAALAQQPSDPAEPVEKPG
ncbi:MAG: TerC/Alx family metal homeostasis membrane protein [Deltaproteobacteria bacterium]|nr:TerC/Alx family metal homeostasis membrane protein [Deltaproteobacteria bacterium]MCW5806668.1 TerC/Alx family metal homeostasis membrane protein [Deltaproteobacteria bacterium]